MKSIDLIHNRLLISAADVISDPLTSLFHRPLREGRFPNQWKHAHVIPIHNKGWKGECNNYHPISLLSCLGKVFERYIHKHLFPYLTTHAILTHEQPGFIPNDSTINNLLSIYNDLWIHFDEGTTKKAVFFDMSKVCDCVLHQGLLTK